MIMSEKIMELLLTQDSITIDGDDLSQYVHKPTSTLSSESTEDTTAVMSIRYYEVLFNVSYLESNIKYVQK